MSSLFVLFGPKTPITMYNMSHEPVDRNSLKLFFLSSATPSKVGVAKKAWSPDNKLATRPVFSLGSKTPYPIDKSF